MEETQVVGFLMDKEAITRRFVRFEGIESTEPDQEILYLTKARWIHLGRPASVTVEVWAEKS